MTNLCTEQCCNHTEGNYQPMGDMKYEYYCPYELAPGMGKGSWAEGGYSENDGLTDQRDAAVALGRLPAAAANYKKTKQPFFIGLGLCVACRRLSDLLATPMMLCRTLLFASRSFCS